MENVVLTVHLIIAVFLIGVVLLQRSEGGALGIGGGGGGLVTGRGAATALSKLTWGLAIAFIVTSLLLTVLAAQRASDNSVLERIDAETPSTAPSEAPLVPGLSVLPPGVPQPEAADPASDDATDPPVTAPLPLAPAPTE
ncbi:MAG: preprotein translocase subunit SecG [Pseudomonadota bacterium]